MPSLTPKALVRNRVRSSALRLDRERPDWYRKIDTSKLDMGSCETCILGQLLYRPGMDWEDVLDAAGIDEHTADLRGFNIGDEKTATDEVDYEDLELAWAKEINKRRAADK